MGNTYGSSQEQVRKVKINVSQNVKHENHYLLMLSILLEQKQFHFLRFSNLTWIRYKHVAGEIHSLEHSYQKVKKSYVRVDYVKTHWLFVLQYQR